MWRHAACNAGGGKTSCYECLRLAQVRLVRGHQPTDGRAYTQPKTATASTAGGLPNNQDPAAAPWQFDIHAHVLNPKAISLPELYGSYSSVTHDWADGLASSLIRRAVMQQTQDMHWVVFDGPVDAVWIENMNTGLYRRVQPHGTH